MQRRFSLAFLTAIAAASITLPAMAAGPLDRIEDRVDHAENRIDRRHDNGLRDRVEDRVDRIEGILDRNGIEGAGWIDRRERQKWRRLATPPCVTDAGTGCAVE